MIRATLAQAKIIDNPPYGRNPQKRVITEAFHDYFSLQKDSAGLPHSKTFLKADELIKRRCSENPNYTLPKLCGKKASLDGSPSDTDDTPKIYNVGHPSKRKDVIQHIICGLGEGFARVAYIENKGT